MVIRRRTPHLIGREQVLRELFDALDDVGEAGSLVLVPGEAGIGKTRLLEEFSHRAGDVIVARGGCIEGVPYAPWTDALWWLTGPSGLVDTGALPGGVREQLARLLPQLGDAEPADAADASGKQRLYEAVLALLGQVAATMRLVLVVDDVHWIDPASRELLRYVAANLRRAPMLAVVAYRPEDSASERELLAHLGRLSTRRVTLERLPTDAASEIATLLLGDDASDASVERIVRDADGNPLFVEELVAAHGGPRIPETLRDLMLVRFDSLDDDARHLVRTAALIGPRAPRAWLTRAAGIDEARTQHAASAALESGVLVTDIEAEGYSFRHALLRQAVIEDLVPDERVALHRAIAEALDELAGRVVGVDRESELARHWDAAEQPSAALRALVAAARHAEQSYAFDAAADAYERALFWWDAADDPPTAAGLDRAALLVAAAEAAGFAGRIERAADLARAGLSAAVELGAERGVETVARVYPLLWTAGLEADLYAFASEELEPQLGNVSAQTRARFLVATVEHLLRAASIADVHERVAEMVAALDDVTDARLLSRAYGVLAMYHELRGAFAQSDTAYKAAADEARRANDVSTLTLALYNHAAFFTSIPRLRDCLDMLDEVDDMIEKYGLRRFFMPARCLRVLALTRLGELEDARNVLGSISDLDAEGYDAWFRAIASAQLYAYAGDADAALAALEPRHVGSPLPNDPERIIEVTFLRVLALSQKGDVVAARQAADDAVHAVDQYPETYFQGWLTAMVLRTELIAAESATASRHLDAVELAQDRARTFVDRWLAALAQLEEHHPLVRALAAAFDYGLECLAGARAAHLAGLARVAGDLFDEIELRYYATYFRWREGEARIAAGDFGTGMELLRAARSTARQCGFDELDGSITNMARTHQLRIGPGRTTIDGDAALSDRELEVLRLLVDGRSNPDIAETLSISRHTARAHVSNILRKLDASSRAEAVAAAHRRGVV